MISHVIQWLMLNKMMVLTTVVPALVVITSSLINRRVGGDTVQTWLHVVMDVLSVFPQKDAEVKMVGAKESMVSPIKVPFLMVSHRPVTDDSKTNPSVTPMMAILPLIFFALISMGAKCSQIPKDLGACVLDPVPQAVNNVIPAVTAIIMGGAPDWQAQLTGLERLGVGVVVCAIEKIAVDLSATLPPAKDKAQIDPRIYGGIQRCQIYLVAKKVQLPLAVVRYMATMAPGAK